MFANPASTYRDEEGRDLLGKRTMDFKVSYLDAGLATSYFEGDAPSPSAGPKLNPRRYKTQLRDFLSSCRTKRKPTANDLYAESAGFAAYPSPTAPYMAPIPGYPSPADTTLYMQQAPTYQSLYPGRGSDKNKYDHEQRVINQNNIDRNNIFKTMILQDTSDDKTLQWRSCSCNSVLFPQDVEALGCFCS